MDLGKRIEYLLKVSNFPSFKPIAYKERFPQLIDFESGTKQIHFHCLSVSARKVAKAVSLSLSVDFLYNSRSKYPPYYLIKPYFVDLVRDSHFGNKQEDLNKIKDGSIIIFDGVDEANSITEMNYISTFLSPLILMGKPLILLSNGRLTEEMISKYNATSFGVQLLEIEEIIVE